MDVATFHGSWKVWDIVHGGPWYDVWWLVVSKLSSRRGWERTGGFMLLEADFEAWVSSVGVLFTHFTNEADVNEGTN